MKFIKQIMPARQIDAVRSFAAQTKEAFVSVRDGQIEVTEMQTNSNGIDCRWTANDLNEAVNSLIGAGYQIEIAA